MEKEALIIDDLHHKYNNNNVSNWVLNAIDLKIETGELLGLLGPSGCGKTTLLRLIAGFEFPNKGKITLNNSLVNSLTFLSVDCALNTTATRSVKVFV